MAVPNSDYEGREWPEPLYAKVSEKLTDQGLKLDRVPDRIHAEALDLSFASMGTPKNISGILLENDMVEIEDIARFAETYREGIRTLDMKYNGRNEHDRGVDALMQRYADGAEIEDYDILIKNAFFTDMEYTPWAEEHDVDDMELTGWRTAIDRVASDADFIGVNLDDRKLSVEEVKKPNTDLPAGIREKKSRRAYKQNQKFMQTIDVIETPFTAEAGVTYTYSLTGSEYLMPDVFDGNIHAVSDLSDKGREVRELQELLGKLSHDSAWSCLEPVERQSADPAYLTSST